MQRPGSRPYRATIYLPGHGEDGRLVPVRKVSAATEAGLEKVLARYRAEGYAVVAYQEVPLEYPGADPS